MPTDAITGAIAGYQDLGALWDKGGYLVDIGSWTIDGGNGPEDYTVFISSEGQLAVFTGVDPTTSGWALKGTFNVAPPVGKRCLRAFGSDLLIITHQGVLPISQVLPFDPSADRSAAITQRIQNAMITAANRYGDNFGWELISYPNESLLFMNVPITNGGGMQEQYVMNTLTGAWFKITGWEANTFTIFNDNLFFGDIDGNVNWAWQGGSDNGNEIRADLQCAFNWYDTPGRLKRVTFVQPLMTNEGSTLLPAFGIDIDFASTSTITQITQTGSAQTLWDVAEWDESLWGGEVVLAPWLSVNAMGKALAMRVKMIYSVDTTNAPPTLKINAFNTIVEMGGMI